MAYKQQLYVVGGHDGEVPLSTVDVYDVASGAWSPKQKGFKLKFARPMCTVASIKQESTLPPSRESLRRMLMGCFVPLLLRGARETKQLISNLSMR